MFVPHTSIHCSATPWFRPSSTCASLGQELPGCTTPVRLIVVADRGKFTQVYLKGFGVFVKHLIHSCYFISPNNANTFPNLRTLIAEHGIRICLAGVSVFCSIMGNKCVTSSTDVCAVTLRYMRVLLIDLQINVCVRRNSFIPRHGTQYCYHVSVLNLALHHVLSHCRRCAANVSKITLHSDWQIALALPPWLLVASRA